MDQLLIQLLLASSWVTFYLFLCFTFFDPCDVNVLSVNWWVVWKSRRRRWRRRRWRIKVDVTERKRNENQVIRLMAILIFNFTCIHQSWWTTSLFALMTFLLFNAPLSNVNFLSFSFILSAIDFTVVSLFWVNRIQLDWLNIRSKKKS